MGCGGDEEVCVPVCHIILLEGGGCDMRRPMRDRVAVGECSTEREGGQKVADGEPRVLCICHVPSLVSLRRTHLLARDLPAHGLHPRMFPCRGPCLSCCCAGTTTSFLAVAVAAAAAAAAALHGSLRSAI